MPTPKRFMDIPGENTVARNEFFHLILGGRCVTELHTWVSLDFRLNSIFCGLQVFEFRLHYLDDPVHLVSMLLSFVLRSGAAIRLAL
jgi:hypothetical protein